MATIGLYVTRGLQLIFGAVVLGLSVNLVRSANDSLYYCHKNPSGDRLEDYLCDFLHKFSTAVEYAAFTGAFGLLDALIGLVAVFVTAVPWLVPLVVDALAAIFFLAGGINSAVFRASWFEGACDGSSDCTKYTSATAFMFLGFIASVVAFVLVYLRSRSGASRSSTV